MTIAAPVFAVDLPKPVDKFTRGTMEIIKSPLVIIDHTKGEMENHDNVVFGFVKGLVESPFHLIKKAGGGLFTVLTFPIDN